MAWNSPKRGTLLGTEPLLYRAAPQSMQPCVIMLLRTWPTMVPWQLTVPQLMWLMRSSPGLTKRTNSGDSWLRRVYERTGLAEERQASGFWLGGAAGQPPAPCGRGGPPPLAVPSVGASQ